VRLFKLLSRGSRACTSSMMCCSAELDVIVDVTGKDKRADDERVWGEHPLCDFPDPPPKCRNPSDSSPYLCEPSRCHCTFTKPTHSPHSMYNRFPLSSYGHFTYRIYSRVATGGNLRVLSEVFPSRCVSTSIYHIHH
jgi:hypothetical protein